MENIDYQQNLTFEFPELDGKARLRELILYISLKCADDPTFGATKLNKILFYSDFISFGKSGKPVAGIEYQRLPNGPAPKQLLPVRKQMENEADIAIQKISHFDKMQHRTVALRDPDLSAFSGNDIALVDAVIKELWDKTAKVVSEISHQRAWRITKDRESIPYEAIFLSDDDCTESDAARVKELNSQYRWE